jgi:hypothetical protein
MDARLSRRGTALVAVGAVVLATAAAVTVGRGGEGDEDSKLPWKARELQGAIQGETGELSEREHGGEPEDESREAGVIAKQFADARLAPGWVQPGAYSAAYDGWKSLTLAPGSWQEVTTAPYNSDDTRYKDYYSNSGAGSGYVSGRPPAVAVDPGTGYVFEAGAVGGVMRSKSGTGGWEPISDDIPASASGDLEVIDGTLWYATGDAATGSTTYVGNGVYATSPTGAFTDASKVGGKELDGDTILSITKSGSRIYVAGAYGVWSHSADLANHRGEPWTREFAPHPEYLPGGEKQFDASSATQNIAFDVIGDPKQAGHLLAAFGWVDGADYNGWYEKAPGGSWTRFKPQGAVKDLQLGKTTFEYSADGSTLYALVQTPILKGSEFYYSELQGAYVSKSGSFTGPWSKIADSNKLANSGSALKAQVPHVGLYFTAYQPGVQAWYNQFLGVDPANPKHVFLGLEEVYESFNGGATWRTTGPYWNFLFPCWTPGNTDPQNGCPTTTHSDQHDIAFGNVGGEPTAFVSNDGGVYSWPMTTGQVNKDGHGLSWKSLSEDGTLRILQYYAVDAGRQNAAKTGFEPKPDRDRGGLIVSGGLQDNGGSILFEGEQTMGSDFGGDGGDVLVDPNDGCNIVQEYTNLTMRVTNKCAAPTDPNAAVDLSKAASRQIKPADNGARFTAPFAADAKDITSWIAGGRYIWHNAKGFDIQTGSDWTKDLDLGAGNAATAVAADGGVAIAGFCGNGCNPVGFTRGLAVGTPGDPTSWKRTGDPGGPTTNVVDGSGAVVRQLPNRYVGAVAVDPTSHALVVAFNGYSRRWVAGPGVSTNPEAGTGHVFISRDKGVTWTDISANLPDVPLSSVKVLSNGALVAASDLGVVYTPSATTGTWYRLGAGLPLTVVTDLEVEPNGDLYAATYGRGIWKIAGATVGATPADGGIVGTAASRASKTR